MNRREAIEWCKRSPDIWDVIIIGGGATGLGAAVDAASRGFRTLLLEQSDFAKGTSSRSTKLIHGGLRYLKQGHIPLVMEGLRERGILCENAPHLVSHLGFVVPNYKWWERPFYAIGLYCYDLLSGKLLLDKSHGLTVREALTTFPTLDVKNLRAGSVYYDGQFDDARLAISLAQTAVDLDAVVINYMPVKDLIKEEGKVTGVVAVDSETGETYRLHGKTIINATGVFTDEIRNIDAPGTDPIIAPSQGIHIVLDRSFMPSEFALLIPETEDGRVLFFIPWHHHLLIGTTDIPIEKPTLEPIPHEDEIDYLLKYAATYLTRKPKRSDILSVFAGLRPLVKKGTGKTAALERNHVVKVSNSNLITICGGKWTTYRSMAEDVINKAIEVGHLDNRPCNTKTLHLHGYKKGVHYSVDSWRQHGSDASLLEALIDEHPDLGQQLHPHLPYLKVEIIWAVRHEMARTLEDVLSRRTRSLLLNAKAALEIAPRVAHMLAKELGKTQAWENEQLAAFTTLAQSYIPTPIIESQKKRPA